MGVDAAEDVKNRLQKLTSLGNARDLFSYLNYEPVTAGALPRRDWPDDVRGALAGDPTVIARHGDFHIIYSKFAARQLERGKERQIVERLSRDHRYALFLFSNDDESDWHFVNIKYDDDATRRRVIRRFAVGPDERIGDRLYTVSQRLGKVALGDDELRRLERAPLEVQRRYDEAFDVEAVTKEFFRRYKEIFESVEESIAGFGQDTERRRLFTQRLFNRLMFIAFIQKKGWLRMPDQADSDYLSALWRSYQRSRKAGDEVNFYQDRLELLFFNGLNSPHGDDAVHANRGSFIEQRIGRVPYLNGGLFEPGEDDNRPDLVVPDAGIEAVLRDLFGRFNFTITESTPLDQEVAVDPEMLGKIFEELVTGRHETGSYYTPKPIVSFMCREALKGYLGARLPSEAASAVERFVEEHDPCGLRNPEAVLDALKGIRACDPACGSGAYLLGMLHELLDLRECLFAVRTLDSPSVYRRKLEIIENNVYGVDIDEFAVNIARLRLWLSLAVEFGGSTPEPLPNLDFKIEQGDSVLGPKPPATVPTSMRDQTIKDYVALKTDFLTARERSVKSRLLGEIEEKKRQIAIWTHGGKPSTGFDWAVEFAEVFADGGFDVVLANPPYVRQELIRDIKPDLKRVYGSLYSGTADLYVYFYYRALQLLRPAGMLVFISSNKWFRANYGKQLRAHMAQTASVRSITDFGDLPVFEASAYPMVFTAAKDGHRGSTRYTEVPSLAPPYPDVLAVTREHGRDLPAGALNGEHWTLADNATARRVQIMASAGITLGDYVKGQIYYGIKTGFNKAFVIDGQKRAELIAADPKSTEIIKPFVVGRDIAKWRIDYKDRWLIVTKIGVPIARYPAIFEHLTQWQPELEKRWDKGNHWWELRACDYYAAFEQPKIVYPDIAKAPRFALDTTGVYAGNTVYLIAIDDLYLLGILNSDPMLELYLGLNALIRGGYLRFFGQYIERLPMPNVQPPDRAAIADLVQQCLDAKGQGPHIVDWEAEINARVARLYGLDGSQGRGMPRS